MIRYNWTIFLLLVIGWTSIGPALPSSENIHDKFTVKATVSLPKFKDEVVFGFLSTQKDQTTLNSVEVRLINNGKIISSVQFDPLGGREKLYSTDNISADLIGDKGFSGHPILINFHYTVPACGAEVSDTLIVLKDNKLKYGLKASSSIGSKVFGNYYDEEHHFVFPTDKNGSPNCLSVIFTFEDREMKRARRLQQTYSWDGEKFKHIASKISRIKK